jgi:hypothetical protein
MRHALRALLVLFFLEACACVNNRDLGDPLALIDKIGEDDAFYGEMEKTAQQVRNAVDREGIDLLGSGPDVGILKQDQQIAKEEESQLQAIKTDQKALNAEFQSIRDMHTGEKKTDALKSVLSKAKDIRKEKKKLAAAFEADLDKVKVDEKNSQNDADISANLEKTVADTTATAIRSDAAEIKNEILLDEKLQESVTVHHDYIMTTCSTHFYPNCQLHSSTLCL